MNEKVPADRLSRTPPEPEKGVHRPAWTPEAVERFWNYTSSKTTAPELYFSNAVGDGVVNFAVLAGVLRGEVLDYGCGPGFLIERLLRRKVVRVYGADLSARAVEVVKARFTGVPGWCGASVITGLPTYFPDASFDVVFVVEMLEHLEDDLLHRVCDEVKRLLRPGGAAVVTTPNGEDLDAHFAYCPFCNSEFHAVQHMQRFTADSMRELLAGHGFEVPLCVGASLFRFQVDQSMPRIDRISLRSLVKWLYYRMLQLLDRVRPRPNGRGRVFRWLLRPGDHLCAVAVRKGD